MGGRNRFSWFLALTLSRVHMRFMFELSNTAISRVEWILFHAYGRVIRMFINPHKTSIHSRAPLSSGWNGCRSYSVVVCSQHERYDLRLLLRGCISHSMNCVPSLA